MVIEAALQSPVEGDEDERCDYRRKDRVRRQDREIYRPGQSGTGEGSRA